MFKYLIYTLSQKDISQHGEDINKFENISPLQKDTDLPKKMSTSG